MADDDVIKISDDFSIQSANDYLHFRGPFTNTTHSTIVIENQLNYDVAFNIKATALHDYSVGPSKGFVKQKETTLINVMCKPFKYDPDKNPEHHFLFMITGLPHGETNLDNIWKKASHHGIQYYDMTTVFHMPRNSSDQNGDTNNSVQITKEPELRTPPKLVIVPSKRSEPSMKKQKCDELEDVEDIFSENIDIPNDFQKITPEMKKVIAKAFEPGYADEPLSCIDKLVLTKKDIRTLAKNAWLNDQVINFYLKMIIERNKLANLPSVYAFNTFFFTSLQRGYNSVRNWTKKEDIFYYDILLVPIHDGGHWALLFIDNRKKRISCYDSMPRADSNYLKIIQEYLLAELQDKKKVKRNLNTYSLYVPTCIPEQTNLSDCGLYLLKYAEYLARDASITFTQEHMHYFRRMLVYELLSKQIL